jgi:hypothetical protein
MDGRSDVIILHHLFLAEPADAAKAFDQGTHQAQVRPLENS